MQSSFQQGCCKGTVPPFRAHARQQARGLFGLGRPRLRTTGAARRTPEARLGAQQVTAQQQQQQDSSSAHQPGSVPVRFMLQRELPFGQSHVVVGSHSFLGAWDLKSAAQMTWGEDHIWQAEVFLPTGTSTEFKCVRVIENQVGGEEWEAGENHLVDIPETGVASVAVAVGWGSYATVMVEPDGATKAAIAKGGVAAAGARGAAAAAGQVPRQGRGGASAGGQARPGAPTPTTSAGRGANSNGSASRGALAAAGSPNLAAGPAGASSPAGAAGAPAPAVEQAGSQAAAHSGGAPLGSVLLGLVALAVFAYVVGSAVAPQQVAVLEKEAIVYLAKARQVVQELVRR